MEFDSLSAFLAMGKHGFYVWLAYGLSAFVIAVNLVLPIREKKQLMRQIKRQQQREAQHAPSA